MWHNRKRIILFSLIGFLVLTFPVSSQDKTAKNDSSGYAFNSSQRDPLSPLISKNGFILIAREMDVTGMALRGIIYSEGASVAIINDEVVKVGDFVGEYKALSIEEKKVILEKDGQEFTLKLEE